MKSWTLPVVRIASVTIGVVTFMVLTDMGPNVAAVAALCVLAGVGLWFLADVVNSPVEPIDPASGTPSAITHTDRRVMRLRSGLVYGRHDDTPLENLRATLVELIDDQLLHAHQVDRAEDPASARLILGDELSALVDDPKTAHELARPQRLDRVLNLIERI